MVLLALNGLPLLAIVHGLRGRERAARPRPFRLSRARTGRAPRNSVPLLRGVRARPDLWTWREFGVSSVALRAWASLPGVTAGAFGHDAFHLGEGMMAATGKAMSELRAVVFAAVVLGPAGAGRAEVLLHYDFSDGSGTTVTDLSSKGNHGTLTDFGNTTAGAGAFGVSEGWVSGGGLSFLDDGVRSYVQTPLSQSAVHGGAFTIELTASADGPSNWTPAIGSDQGPGFDASETFFLGINNSLSFIEVRVPPDGGGIGNPAVPIPWTLPGDQSDPALHHVALTYNGTNRFDLYIDGAYAGGENRGALSSATSNFIIGNTGHDGGEQWDGVISGVAISDRRLTPGDFVLTGPQTLLHYDFGDGSGTTVTDLSGNGNHGELVNFTDTTAGAGSVNGAQGWVSGGGLNFVEDAVPNVSGDENRVQTPLPIGSLDDRSFTLEMLSTFAGTSTWAPALGQGGGSGAGSIFFFGVSDDNDTVAVNLSGSQSDNAFADNPWNGDETHHLALVYSLADEMLHLYVDGDLVATDSVAPSAFNFPASGNLWIGDNSHSSTEAWAGTIYGVAVTQGVLDPDSFVLTRDAFVIPEPSAMVLLALGSLVLLGLAPHRRMRGGLR